MTRLLARALPFAALAVMVSIQPACSSGDSGAGGGGGSVNSCVPSAAECYATDANEPGAACLAKADNTGDTIQMRISQLEVSAPPTLSAPFMQDAIITKKVTLTEPNCFQGGDAQFNTLFEFNTSTMKVKAGGGVPQALIGPAKDGTCFANFTDTQSGITIGPTEADFTQNGNQVHAVFNAGGQMNPPQPDLVLPIYLENKLDQYVLLPLHQVDITANLSADHNCVGKFNGDTLSPGTGCVPDVGSFAWTNDGSYSAYITVAESNTVMVQSLGYSLCVLLSGDVKKWKGPTTIPCGEDTTGKPVVCASCTDSEGFNATGALPEGDWCSTTNSAGGCKDAFHLETNFAASAIKIKGNFDPATNKCSG